MFPLSLQLSTTATFVLPVLLRSRPTPMTPFLAFTFSHLSLTLRPRRIPLSRARLQRESLFALLSVKRAASHVAFKMVRCNVYVLCWCVFPHPLSFSCLWQGVEIRFLLLSMQFRARHSRASNSLCYTSFVHMPEMYLAC